ncbi:toll/interleukin-1 receptor domain-containing protein [Arcticibacterium luteifluviistationis]|uniref:TIR domain-containing protein n=1 Tax=Arcticibacterium luteifluviistationis TaxID=1784714 RepID=A0A2Z4G8W4_9BACT|nr:toll/interleukin-1 receptor domain-containing protein [Arcticibacterium luteifluviistationis]AWV97689.1 hypothetical protein DJ013_05720 [Arcticibacterium luteifluviistationis]
MDPIKVFISRKSEDSKWGIELYHYLEANNIVCFDSTISLPKIGSTQFRKTIDEVLEQSQHMILIASKIDFLHSQWVHSEWDAFENEVRSGRKKGNLLLIISKKIKIQDLPITLRQKQIFYLEDKPYQEILPFLGHSGIPKHIKEKHPIQRKQVIKICLAVFTALLLYFFLYPSKTSQTVENDKVTNPDSMFSVTENRFLKKGLDKKVALQEFKKLTLIKPALGYQGAEVFQKKAISTPFMKDTYLAISEELIVFTDSLLNAK